MPKAIASSTKPLRRVGRRSSIPLRGHSWEVIGANGDFYGSIVATISEQVATAKQTFEKVNGDATREDRPVRPTRRDSAGPWQFRIEEGRLERRRINLNSNEAAVGIDNEQDGNTEVDENGDVDVDQPVQGAVREQDSIGGEGSGRGDDRISKFANEDLTWQSADAVNEMIRADFRVNRFEISPDGGYVAMWSRKNAEDKNVYTIESSPDGGGRAVLRSRRYPLPGDEFDQYHLIVCDSESLQPVSLDLPVFDFGRPSIHWFAGHKIAVQKVDRGHQRFRLFVIDPAEQSVKLPIDEQTETFIWTVHGPDMPIISYLEQSDRVVYASEQSGWRHLYLVDLDGDQKMRPLTTGEFLVRDIEFIDEEQGYIDIIIGSYHPGQDPYHQHLARVGLDQQSMVVVTDGDGDHRFRFSPDRQYIVDSYSRVDAAPIHELRRVTDGKKLATLATAKRLGKRNSPAQSPSAMPTVFTAKGRDGKTDIWGLICFPENYNPDSDQQYPVIEAIYAGPHGSHVPKQYRDKAFHPELTSLGFIVVQIDGMGTANRSKAFHDVCWQNLKDAGFPDRISWMRAAAEKYPGMDLSRVGIYGTSAGGQNAMGALLFHGDFYKAAMGACGCHDNRMDKASWNEQWMGYPVGPHYAESSNVDNADRLSGDLLLILGELDTNVPPESTLRVVDALIQSDKQFEFLMIPGMGHSSGGRYGWERTKTFFVNALNPPQPMSNEDSEQAIESVSADVLSSIEPDSPWNVIRRQYEADLGSLQRQYPLVISPVRLSKLQEFFDSWKSALPSMVSADNDPTADEIYVSLLESIDEAESKLRDRRSLSERLISDMPVLSELVDLCHLGYRGRPLDYTHLARRLESIESQLNNIGKLPKSDWKKNLLAEFNDWKVFYSDFDPQFDWWCGTVAEKIADQLNSDGDEDGTGSKMVDPTQVATQTDRNGVATADDPIHASWADFPAEYPTQWRIDKAADVFMPSVIRLFQDQSDSLYRTGGDGQDESDKAARITEWLNQWQSELQSFERPDRPFEQWAIGDQVDYHLLLREISTRLEKQRFADVEPVIAKSSDGSGIEGTVVGRDRLMLELADQFIGDDPERLIELAEIGLSETHDEMIEVANLMGCGDDWHAAIELMKQQHVDAGEQPSLIRDTAEESIRFLRDNDWITIDRLAETCWRMDMMSPERQRVNPFFTGGETISISFPTAEMTNTEKLQSLRGNNIPFVRTTVHHELIPGHHMQQYQNSRYQTQRRRFGTPFWLEGWAVYWEFILYDNGFPRTPKERMGSLVWRAHRYARIIFSLRFHLGQMSPDQCTDFLVDQVGFERRNSEAEVRRSVGPSYPPLYQAAYMVGAMQLRQLAARWTAEGRPIKEFHDAVMRQGSLPIALLRATLWNEPLDRNSPPLMEFTVSD